MLSRINKRRPSYSGNSNYSSHAETSLLRRQSENDDVSRSSTFHQKSPRPQKRRSSSLGEFFGNGPQAPSRFRRASKTKINTRLEGAAIDEAIRASIKINQNRKTPFSKK